jgi:metal transporter CNNM
MSSIPSVWIWLGIVLCVAQSAAFSGLNLAVFSLSQLRLQLEADAGNADAMKVLDLRKDSNRVLSTIIWGNVSTNVLLTLLSDSVLAGVYAFLFSAVVITLAGEIFPQAYFSRNALRMTSRFLPFLRFYLFALYPLTKPTAMVLDAWLGKEGITYLAEKDIRSLLARSAVSGGDIGRIEAAGAQNFLDLDDVPVCDEGEAVHPESIISLPLASGRCVLPKFERSPDDPFLRQVDASDKNGSSSPTSRASRCSCWIPITSCAMRCSMSSIPTRRPIGTARSSCGIPTRGSARSSGRCASFRSGPATTSSITT